MTGDVGGTVSIDRVRIDARAHEIAEQLIGTLHSKSDAMTQEEIDDPALEAALNDLMFECDSCGWWCSTDELNNDGELEGCDEACDGCLTYEEYEGDP